MRILNNNFDILEHRHKEIFEKHWAKEQYHYSNNWLYLLRLTHCDISENPLFYQDEDLIFALGIRYGAIYMSQPLGTINIENLIKILTQISCRWRLPIIIKKVKENIYKELLSSKLFTQNIPSSIDLEDERFNETYLDLKTLFDKNHYIHRDARKFRLSVNRFINQNIQVVIKKNLHKHKIENNLVEIENFLKDDFKKFNAYTPIVKDIFRNPQSFNTVRISQYYIDNKIHGLYISDEISKNINGLYCSITSKAYGGITEYLDYRYFKSLVKSEVDKLFIGGSENKGINKYIEKLKPKPVNYNTMPIMFNATPNQ